MSHGVRLRVLYFLFFEGKFEIQSNIIPPNMMSQDCMKNTAKDQEVLVVPIRDRRRFHSHNMNDLNEEITQTHTHSSLNVLTFRTFGPL